MPRVEQVQQKALEEFREKNRNAAKRKKNKGARQFGESMITFVCLFFLLSLFFLQLAKMMTPKIDTSVGSNAEVVENTEPKATIDERLKLIQFNDAMAAGEIQRLKAQEIFNEELDEKVVLPSDKKSENEDNKEEVNLEVQANLNEKVQNIISKNLTEVQKLDSAATTKENNLPVQNIKTAPVPPAVANVSNTTATSETQKKEELDRRISAIKAADINLPSTNYKVLVGQYQTAEQAQLAKSIIRETELGQNAFVKQINNIYTIQIGSYSTAEQAQIVANKLTTGSFPARVYYEKPNE